MPTSKSSSIDLNPHDLKEVLQVLNLYLPAVEVRAFGSRVKWTAKPYSDIDLALMTDRPLSLEQAALLREAFDETTIPFKVDFVDWASTSDSFRRIIQASSVVIRPAETSIADHSKVLSLDEALEALLDYRGKTPTKTTSGVPLITAKIVKNGRIETPAEFIAPEDYSAWMTRGLPKEGDVVLTTEAPLGEVAQLNSAHVALAQRIVVLRGKADVLDNTYLRYLLQTAGMQEQLAARATGTTVVGIKQSELRKIAMRLPPVRRQRAIATVLSSLDDKIELNRRMNETLEAMARAIFQSWFVDFDPVRAKASGESADSICQRLGLTPELLALFPDSFEDSELGEIPVGWVTKLFSEAITINPTGVLKKGVVAPYLDMANMPTASARAHEVVAREFGSGMKFQNGDTLVARITPCLENGKTCFVDFLEDDQVGWGSTEYIVLRPNPPLPPEYGYFLARTEKFRDHAIANMTGTSGRQRVPASAFDDVRLVIPGVEVAKAFGMYARATVESMRTRDTESRTLTVLRDSLLPKLLSGELTPSQLPS